MVYTLGIDIGSTTSKCVILEDGKTVRAKSLVKAGTGTDGPIRAYNEVLESAGLKREDLAFVMATGYGRTTFEGMDAEMSELSCHAKGMYAVAPEVRTIIDIGGQDAKVIRLGNNGKVTNFLMNDKCAAGTGRVQYLHGICGIRSHFPAFQRHCPSGSDCRNLQFRRKPYGSSRKACGCQRSCLHDWWRGQEYWRAFRTFPGIGRGGADDSGCSVYGSYGCSGSRL